MLCQKETPIETIVTIALLLGKGDGTFQSQQTFTVGSNPHSVAAADLNADGTPPTSSLQMLFLMTCRCYCISNDLSY